MTNCIGSEHIQFQVDKENLLKSAENVTFLKEKVSVVRLLINREENVTLRFNRAINLCNCYFAHNFF